MSHIRHSHQPAFRPRIHPQISKRGAPTTGRSVPESSPRKHGPLCRPQEVDEEGLLPDSLAKVMAARAVAGLQLPKVVYLIPHGQVPRTLRPVSRHHPTSCRHRRLAITLRMLAAHSAQRTAASQPSPGPGWSNRLQ